jgi:hypothetical protein
MQNCAEPLSNFCRKEKNTNALLQIKIFILVNLFYLIDTVNEKDISTKLLNK